MQWWGYLHTSGWLHAKPYHPTYGEGDMDDAYESPFCAKVVGPFYAANREDALNQVKYLTSEK